MKALRSHAVGGPETLTLDEVESPVPGPGQVRVRVKACSINFPDVLIIQDLYQFKPPRPFAPGGEASGVVDAVGEGVTQWKVGDRVIASTGNGGLSEEIVVDAARLWALPDYASFETGASLLMTYGTNMHGLLDRGRLKAGETLLVLGAAGGIGLSAVELGKAYGARVIAAVSSEEKAQAARETGADDVVIYPRAPFDKDQNYGASLLNSRTNWLLRLRPALHRPQLARDARFHLRDPVGVRERASGAQARLDRFGIGISYGHTPLTPQTAAPRPSHPRALAPLAPAPASAACRSYPSPSPPQVRRRDYSRVRQRQGSA